MQASGACTSADGSFNEDTLTGSCRLSHSSLKKFRYFVVESSVILALMEPEPEPEQPPSLMMVVRGPSGRHSWALQLHLLPRSGQVLTQKTQIQEKHIPSQEDSGRKWDVTHHLFAENMDRVPLVKADRSIPALHNAVSPQVQQQLVCLHAALKNQQLIESQPQVSRRSVAMTTCRPPPPITNFHVTRLFLSHMGLLTPESVKDPGISGVLAPLVSLDSSLPGFSENLRHLDQLPSRTCDSAFVFYMRAGQKTAAEILRNVENSTNVQSDFLDFLSSLGWPEEVGQQQRVGGANPSSPDFAAVLGNSGGGVFDGRSFILKSIDSLMDITFIVPSSETYNDWLRSSEEVESTSSSLCHADVRLDSAPKSSVCPAEDIPSGCGVSTFASSVSKLLIIWVERFEDIESFPLSGLLSETRSQTDKSSSVHLIFIHPLKTGLYRICFKGNSKFGLAVPLVSGSVVSRRSLGFLVTEMVINCCHRHRLESDSVPPPHMRRKHVINDIILRYSVHFSEPEFYSALFHR